VTVLGLDIGGASIKAATSKGWADSRRFSLWRTPDRLAEQLKLLTESISFETLAVTMTGELCDAFQTKEEGVHRILDSVSETFPHVSSILVWQTTGAFCSLEQARLDPWKTGSANWLALATYASRLAKYSHALLIDIGSTTTDIIPMMEGQPIPRGRTDPARLASGELVYSGVRRTPIASLLQTARINNIDYRIMREFFATSLDAYLVLNEMAEDPSATDTADGRPETVLCAVDRLARMIGSDRTRFTLSDASALAEQTLQSQLVDIQSALVDVAEQSSFPSIDLVITSGEGEFLARKAVNTCERTRTARRISLADEFSSQTSRAACAYAIALLAEHR
jgi:probable H4MPT-linked C1 transfer pathway protein